MEGWPTIQDLAGYFFKAAVQFCTSVSSSFEVREGTVRTRSFARLP
jgi:hypothetical protein